MMAPEESRGGLRASDADREQAIDVLTADQPPGMPARVRRQRTQREMSQGDLAQALGVSRQTVISIENGRYLPSLPLAFAIARFFNLTVDTMFGPDQEQAGAR